MKQDILLNKYRDIELIDSSMYITEDIVYDDLDFENIIGKNLIIEEYENFLSKHENQNYIEFLERLMIEYSDLFFYSDLENNRLYFECVIGSKNDAKKKYLLKKMIYQITTKKCPSCSSKLRLKPLEINSVKVDGKTVQCQKYVVYCPECDGIFGTVGFKTIHIIKSLFDETTRFLRSLESIKIGETNEIEFNSNFDSIYRC